MNTRSRFVLFSIERPNNTNEEFRPYVESVLAKHGFKRVLGSYKGIAEDSYMVLANKDDALKEVIKLAKEFNQESILIVDENRLATLQFLSSPTNTTIFCSLVLGRWTSIDPLEAQTLENWTLDGTNYYTVK